MSQDSPGRPLTTCGGGTSSRRTPTPFQRASGAAGLPASTPRKRSVDLSRALRERALALDADLVGIAPAVLPETPAGGQKAYREWVERGMYGEMGYMARSPEDRCEITRWFPAARSVLLAAFSYHDGSPTPAPDPEKGRIARYATAPDYHDELKDRMGRLAAFYKSESGGEAKVFVDTSPVLERLYARYAGIGWVGKNTMILSRRVGSFFLLAGVAVDRKLEYDEPVPDHCGTCKRCIEACPTGAFPRPNVLDASKCIANFTVETRKSPIPEEFREGHGDWIFGCDVCQDVCPWNRFSVRAKVFKPRLEPACDLEEIARLSPQDFNKRYKGTPLRRTGRAAMVRNALLAMGNSGDRRHLPTLEEMKSDGNPLVAEQARWSLRKLNLIE